MFVACDGPNPGRPNEAEMVASTRAVIDQGIDWPCTIERRYTNKNQGCRIGVSGAITWFYEKVELGIILEDDCVAHPDFFRFCEALLKRYAKDQRVWAVTGNNFQNGRQRGDAAYYFSKYPHCWGWATWRRAWCRYRDDLPFWLAWKASADWKAKTPHQDERRYWADMFERVFAREIDSWAYPWTACAWHHGGLTATPNVNLVTNIGFGCDATHTSAPPSDLAALPAEPLGDLRHPRRIEQDTIADRYVFDHAFGGRRRRLPWSLLRLPRRAAGKLYRIYTRSFS
jgi:hypothetical protein